MTRDPALAFLAGGGATGALIRAHHWDSTPLGRPEAWPASLKTLVGIMLGSHQPMFVAWGPARTMLYNDGYAELCRDRHPAALGARFAEVWWDIMDDVGPILDRAFAGEATHMDDIEFALMRDGRPQEAHFEFSYTPVRDEAGAVAGMFCACRETTEEVAARRLAAEAADRHRESEARYRTIFEETTDFIVATDLDQRITVCNPAAAAALGYTPDEVVGRSIRDFVGEAEFKRTTARLQAKLGGGGSTQYELTLHDRRGRPHLWEINSSLSRDANGRPVGLHVLARDVSEARATQAALTVSEERLRLAVEGAGVGLWDWDLVETRGWWSPRTAEIMGVKSGETVTLAERIERIHPEDRRRLRAQLDAALAEGGEFVHEYRIVRPDGEIRHISSRGIVIRDAAGKAVRTTGTVIDVTEDRAAEAALAESEGRLRRAQEAAGIGSYEWDIATGAGQQSDSMLRIIGLETGRTYSLKEVVATVLAEDRAPVMATVEAIGKGAERAETDYRIRRTDDEVRWIRDIGQLERDAEGRPARWVGIVQDVTERKTAELALSDNEARLRTLTNVMPAFIWFARANGELYYFNDRWYEYSGQTPDEALPNGWAETLHPDDAPVTAAEWEAARAAGTSYENECRYRRRDGVYRWHIARAEPQRDADGRIVGWAGTSVDVHDRKAADEALRASEERLRLVQKTGGIGSFDWNMRTGTVFRSPEYLAIHGLPPEAADSAYSDRWFDRIHPDDRAEVEAMHRATLERPGDLANEHRIVRASDGETRWISIRGSMLVDEDGVPYRMIAAQTDITERKQAEAALRESEARLRLAQESGGIGLWDWDLATGETWWSDKLYDIVGLDRDAPRAIESFIGMIHPDDRAFAEDAAQAAIDGDGRLDIEFRVRQPDGRVLWLASRGEVLRDVAGEARRMVGVNFDVTARKAAEAALQQLNEALQDRVAEAVAERELVLAQLHEAQKLETLGQLTGGVAHDFNNLLTPIVGSLDLLRRRLPEDARNTRLIDGALQAADRAQTLVARLLAFGRRQLLQPRPVDVAELLRGLTDLIQRSIGQHIGVVVEPAADLPPARIDPNQLELAILNLAVNARDAMPGGGTLTITAHPETMAPLNEQRLRPGRYVRLSVIDTGTGMDEETLKRAVEPFFTTKGVGKGTGLGLSMIHGLAGQMGGTLKLSSTVGIGTRVDLWLPVAEAAAPVTAEPAASSAPAPDRRAAATVLLVDDEELVRMGAAEMLAELGYAVVEAASGAEALARIEAGEAIDALVTDFLMPGMNGGELIEAVRRLRPKLPALIVSGYANVEGVPANVPILAKPFRHDQLAAEVAAVIDAGKVVRFRRSVEPAR